MKKVEQLWNSAIKEHVSKHPDCNGNLEFDIGSSRQQGLVWRERLKCNNCKFIGKFHNLFETIENSKRIQGVQQAKINVALQTGLMATPIGNKSFCEILMHLNIKPPCEKHMQTIANDTSSKIEKVNKDSMSKIRQTVASDNEMCGIPKKKC